MKLVLEETSSFRIRKDNEIDSLNKVLGEKDRLIEDLKKEMTERDPTVLRDKFREELAQPIKRLEKERDFIQRENERLNYEIKIARNKIEQLEKEVIDSVERVRLSFESEVNLVKKEKEELRLRVFELSQTPDNMKMIQVSDENHKLQRKLQHLKLNMEELETQYKRIQSQVQSLVTEHEQKELEMNNKITSLKDQLSLAKDDSRDFNRLKEEYDRMKKEYSLLQEDLPRVKAEMMETKIISREFQRQKDRYREEYHRIKQLLEEERKELADFKTIGEKNVSRLRRSIEDERRENEERIKSLDHEITCIRKERDDLKYKYKQASQVLSELKKRLTILEKTHQSSFFLSKTTATHDKDARKEGHQTRQSTPKPTTAILKTTISTTPRISKSKDTASCKQSCQEKEKDNLEEDDHQKLSSHHNRRHLHSHRSHRHRSQTT